ncbi:unnamed protein product [Alopecurus aequalis]
MNPQAAAGAWSTGLFDGSDCGLWCITCWWPCITFGRVAEIVDKGQTSCTTSGAIYAALSALAGNQWIYSCTYRTKLRAQFSLPEDPCSDCLVHYFCHRCALRQEYRELKARGFDPDIGWQLNVERGVGGNVPGMQQMHR